MAQPEQPLQPKPWPRLSETLPFPRHPNVCQSCGKETDVTDGVGAHAWQEHDDNDQPEAIVVMLCRACSARLIEPHPRLYNRLDTNQPWPGIMDFCLTCWWRSDVRCRHPHAKANGGRGVTITVRKPTVAHVNMGRGRGRWMQFWPERAEKCAEWEPADEAKGGDHGAA